MAEETKAPVETTATDTAIKDTTESPEESRGFVGGKYKTPEDLEKAYTSLESKLGDWKEKEKRLTELEAYEKQVTPALNFIWEDKEVLEKFRSKVTGETKTETKKPDSQPDPQITELVKAQEDAIVDRFEREHGIDRLSAEEKADIRKRLGSSMAEMLGGRQRAPLAALPKVLENAWKIMNVDRLRETGKAEGILEALMANKAAIGDVPSTSAESSGPIVLSSEQKSVADKLGVSHEDYAKQVESMS